MVTVLNMLTRIRKRATSRAIRPAITSWGIKNDTHEANTKRPVNESVFFIAVEFALPEGRYYVRMYFEACLVSTISNPAREKFPSGP